MNFQSLFTRSKSRKKIELQQGTPEVQNNLRNWKYAANKIIRIKNGRGFKEFSCRSSVNFRSARYGGAITVYICVWHYESS
jgi:hypothetical protein